MLSFKLVNILSVAAILCFLPTNGQTGNWIGCLTKIVCNVAPYISQCCSESFPGEIWNKTEMVSCLYNVFGKEAAACMNGPDTERGEDGEVEQLKYRGTRFNRNGRISSAHREEHSAFSGFRTSSRVSSRSSGGRSIFGKYGSSNFMQSEDCEFIKNNEPNGTDECPTWSEAVSRCVNGIPLVQLICHNGKSKFGGMGNGGFGFGGQSPIGGMGGNGFGIGSQGPFGGMGNGGFGSGGLSPFGGTESDGFGFGGTGSFGGTGNVGFGIGGTGSSGERWKPKFGKPGEGKFPRRKPGDEREYEDLPE